MIVVATDDYAQTKMPLALQTSHAYLLILNRGMAAKMVAVNHRHYLVDGNCECECEISVRRLPGQLNDVIELMRFLLMVIFGTKEERPNVKRLQSLALI